MRPSLSTFLSLSTLTSVLLLSGCNSTPAAKISFAKQVQPIFAKHCLECHDTNGEGAKASGLMLSSYNSVMKGTKFGPVIKPGNSLSSTLIILVEGRANASINMPHGDRPPLSSEEIKTLRQWIDEGANNN